MKTIQFFFSLLLLGLFAACANSTDSQQQTTETEVVATVNPSVKVVEVASKEAVVPEEETEAPAEPEVPELSEAEKAAAAKEKARAEAYKKASDERRRKRHEAHRKKREAEKAAAESVANPTTSVETVTKASASTSAAIEEKDLFISAGAVEKGVMSFTNSVHNFGEIDEGDVIDYSFKFTNTGKGPLEITNVKASCGCTQPTFPFMPIAPGETGKIDVRFNSKGKFGNQKPLISVFTNARTEPYKLYLEGKVKY